MFVAASLDLNPLHTSSDYARRTPFGEPVVFGVLSAIAGLEHFPAAADVELTALSLDFRNPIFAGVDYRVEVGAPKPTRQTLKIYDGSRLMLLGTFDFRPETAANTTGEQHAGLGRLAPADLTSAECRERAVIGQYAPATAAMDRLLDRYKLRGKGLSALNFSALLWASYFVGMELPGLRAAFSNLKLRFPPAEDALRLPIDFAARAVGFDERFSRLEITAELAQAGRVVAEAEIAALVRDDSPAAQYEATAARLPAEPQLQGKTALVVGGSRGLGATILHALAQQGCSVALNYHQSDREAQAVLDAIPASANRAVLLQGDMASPAWTAELPAAVERELGGLDILVCNACPPIRPHSFEFSTVERGLKFLQKSLELVAYPMAALLPLLSARQGCVVLISSEYARTLPAEFFHYSAAKVALEALATTAARQYKQTRFLIVRPPKLLTDQTNTPLGRDSTMPAAQVAAEIARQIADTSWNGVRIVENF